MTGQNAVGGLVGVNHGAVRVSYATGSVSGRANNTGGLVGVPQRRLHRRRPGGQQLGRRHGQLRRRQRGGRRQSGWTGRPSRRGSGNRELLGQTSGKARSPAGQCKTTTELQEPTGCTSIYADWNVDLNVDGNTDDPWGFGTSSEYPMLR